MRQAQGRRKNAADRPDRWLAELTLPPLRKADEVWAYSYARGSCLGSGILPVSLENYVQLLTWTARQLRSGQRDTIPADLASVMDHFDVQQDHWLSTVEEIRVILSATRVPAGSCGRCGEPRLLTTYRDPETDSAVLHKRPVGGVMRRTGASTVSGFATLRQSPSAPRWRGGAGRLRSAAPCLGRLS